MNKISTKLRQKQTAIPKQILQSRFLEMTISDIEEELQSEIEIFKKHELNFDIIHIAKLNEYLQNLF